MVNIACFMTFTLSLSRSKYIVHASVLPRNILTDLQTEFARFLRCLILYILVIFSFHDLDKWSKLLFAVELAWMEIRVLSCR